MGTLRNLARLPRDHSSLTAGNTTTTTTTATSSSSPSSLAPPPPPPPTLFILPRLPFLVLALFSFTIIFIVLQKASDLVSRTRTVVGHNLDPTPWHPFPPKQLLPGSTTNAQIFHCSFLSCSSFHTWSSSSPSSSSSSLRNGTRQRHSRSPSCPFHFRWIHQDLAPWAASRISISNLMEAQKYAALRILIVRGRLYADFYYDCVQSRAMFTLWGFLQLLRRYPGQVPDVDLMFDCMDRPVLNRSDQQHGPHPLPPLFRYCTTPRHFDIPFPDWSFWGWAEVNIGPWDDEFASIKRASQAQNWTTKHPFAYWKGNPDVASPLRMDLLNCNDTRTWGAQIMRQNWVEEAETGFQQSKLSNQCNHRYKIYAEGYAWSVSLKYILSCGSLSLIIHPQYEDFFSRGLMPRENYWPIAPNNLCRSIKFAVDWGNEHPTEAEVIGKGGQDYMQNWDMERVYDYMYHLIVEYSKLLDFKPTPPSSAQEVCEESLLCYADQKQREYLERAFASPSTSKPCILPTPDHHLMDRWIQQKQETIGGIDKINTVGAETAL